MTKLKKFFVFSLSVLFSLAVALSHASHLAPTNAVDSEATIEVANSSSAFYPPNAQYANNSLATISPYRGEYRLAQSHAVIAGRYVYPMPVNMGLQIDIGLSGNVFVTVYSSRALGGSSWDIVQGIYQPSDEVTRWTTGVIGTLTGPIYQAASGLCLKCAINDTGAPAAGAQMATLAWVNSREVTMTIGAEHFDFVALNLDTGSDGDYLVGRWSMHIVQTYDGGSGGSGINPGQFFHDGLATIDIETIAGNLTIAENAVPGLTNYKSGDQLYGWTCAEELSIVYPDPNPLCDEAFANLNFGNTKSQVTFWFDKASNRLGADLVNNSAINSLNTHIDLYVEGPDLIIGRGIIEGTAKVGLDTLPYGLGRDGALNVEVILQRLPADAFGANLPKK